MPAKVKPDVCVGCGACVENCPVQAIKVENGKAVVDPAVCIDCGACVSGCPVEAIELPS